MTGEAAADLRLELRDAGAALAGSSQAWAARAVGVTLSADN